MSIIILCSHGGHVSELIRSQNEDLVNLKLLLNSNTYQQSRVQVQYSIVTIRLFCSGCQYVVHVQMACDTVELVYCGQLDGFRGFH